MLYQDVSIKFEYEELNLKMFTCSGQHMYRMFDMPRLHTYTLIFPIGIWNSRTFIPLFVNTVTVLVQQQI